MHRQHSVPFSDRAAAIERELQGVLSPVFPLCDCPQNALVLKRTVIRILLKIQAAAVGENTDRKAVKEIACLVPADIHIHLAVQEAYEFYGTGDRPAASIIIDHNIRGN